MPHSQLDEDASATAGGNSTTVTLVTDSLEKPSLDDRDYRVIRLDNELEALLVHDPDTDKASAALDVNVGNFSDESDIPGMAHAVEHLLFMGTKKFPIENEYGQYLSANSGSSNAYTGPTSTNYFFDISAKPDNDQDPSDTNPSPLKEALDRFAQFFIEPLFLPETLDRELKAVDSENKKNLQNDTWRLHQLEKSLSNPKHPFCHFSTGNFEVLKTLPEARGINVRDKFIEFHGKHYSANRMKLVVLGREPLDLLQKWVVELFSPVVNKKLPPNRWPGEIPFRDSDLGMQCFAKPVMDSRELNLYFPFIDEEFMFATQPSRYISHLIGHEGPGSIMSYIKSKGWANGLSAGAYPVCPGTPGIFDVQVRLTEEGLKNYPEIVKIFFQYITLLRENPPQEWIFQEQKGMADVDFKFKQKTPASRFTSRISSVMQKPLPREWLLSGHSRLREFAPDQIEEALSTIRPDNFRMVIVSRNHPGNWDQKEKWYGTEYRHEKIPEDLMEDIKKAAAVSPKDRLSALHLPHKNQFIPNKLEVEKKEYNVSLDSRGLFLDVSGYNDKLPVLLEQVVTTMRDLDIKEDRFEIVRERLTRGYNNWQLQSSYHQVGDYTNWLNAPERDFIVEELATELSCVTLEGVRLFQKQMLGQNFIEVYVHGNMYKEDALKATDMVESILKPRVLPKAQWPILRSLILPEGSNHVFKKTLKDPANVNHCVETWFYVGSREDRERYADTLDKMSDTEFEGHKRSLIVRRLEKLRNLDQESTRHWNQITNEYYDFELAQSDAAQIKLLTKPEVAEFYNRHLNPTSKQRARLSIHLEAQGKAEGVDKRQEEAQKKADEEPSSGDAVKTAEEITDVRLHKACLTASSGAMPVKDISEYEDTDAKL
ncbi:Metalloenzyme LuxS/M16 peptidase-like protein [Fusarium acuminatum]|uniref:Metalloenzyme LuxS/M16 peptidase-like protein n=1 Tax=Fusarium acuminatum TaxID=5515 RepID=A0ABZ2WWG6_9HYPO